MKKKSGYGPFAPAIEDKAEREKSIKNDIPAVFKIDDSKCITFGPNISDNMGGFERVRMQVSDAYKKAYDDSRTLDALGWNSVRNHYDLIVNSAKKHGVDPDLIRSVMYAENARGYKLVFNRLFDTLKISKSLMPMNIQKDRWSALIDKNPDDLYDPGSNTEASAILLRRIGDRLENPTASKVGTLWNDIGARETNEFGEYIGRVYKDKPWLKFEE